MQMFTLSVYKDEVWLPGGQQVARHVRGEAGDLQEDGAAAEAVSGQLPHQQLGHQVPGQRGRACHRPQLQAQGRTLPDNIGLIIEVNSRSIVTSGVSVPLFFIPFQQFQWICIFFK